MPLVDLPLPDLYRYAGRNPRPADFDAYWDNALKELSQTDPQPELTPVAIPNSEVECFDLYFTGVGGARIYSKYIRPKHRMKNPVVLQFHGYSGNSGDWFDKLGWAGAGFVYAGMDVRGQGGRSEDTASVKGSTFRGHIIRGLDDPDKAKLAYRQIFLDTVQLARVVATFQEVDAERMGCFGASQGGALALACAALEPRIKRCATASPFLCDYLRVWEMDLVKDAYEEIRYFFRQFDPRHERVDEVFARLGYIDCQHLAARISADVLMFTGLMDTICPPSSQFAAFNKISSKKKAIIYPDFGHEHHPGSSDRILDFMANASVS